LVVQALPGTAHFISAHLVCVTDLLGCGRRSELDEPRVGSVPELDVARVHLAILALGNRGRNQCVLACDSTKEERDEDRSAR